MSFQVRLVFHLHQNYKIAEKDILVMSQYRAQCAKIEQELIKSGMKNVKVSTVVAAQGIH